MKKIIKSIAIYSTFAFFMTSCYTYTTVVGEGAKGNEEIKKWNHYLIGGLAPISVSDPKELAGGAENYDVITKHTFINGLIQGITYGIYAPTTTIIKK